MSTVNYHEIACTAFELGASQDRAELAAVLEIIAAINPTIIVEIGCDRGGTLWAWRRICERVYGITLADNSYDTGGSGEALIDYGAVVHIGDSHDSASLIWLMTQLDHARIDVLVIDGDHSRAGVLNDFYDYGPLVRSGGLILLHDIAVTNDTRAEVAQVWPEIAARYARTAAIQEHYGWGIIYQ